MSLFHYIIFPVLSILLFSCSIFSTNQDVGNKKEKFIISSHVQIKIPEDLILRPSADAHRIADNDFNNNDLDSDSEYRIEVTPIDSPCTPSFTGISNPEPITFTHCEDGALCIQSGSLTSLTSAENLPSPASFNDTSLSSSSQGVTPTAVWGRVEDSSPHGYTDALCKTPITVSREEYWKRHEDPASAYAFCSQKDNKTVLICISQMTDNEKLAREIFSTFKWTK